MNPFDEKYFTSGNYVDYLSRQGRYEKLAQDMLTLYNSINLISPHDDILDYGCATGLLLNGLHKHGFCNTHGYDISEWALSKVRSEHRILELNKKQSFDHCFCLDVLEHMTDQEIKFTFSKLTAFILTVRIPCSLDGKGFHLAPSRADKTHINCKTREEWINFLGLLDYELLFTLNLSQIYDSDGVFCATFKGARNGL
jgi:hypothetical protein|tara:strand:+ start:10166 stop:10759 length:594 start_codon:yes stop_codon:yes gene_type:complete